MKRVRSRFSAGDEAAREISWPSRRANAVTIHRREVRIVASAGGFLVGAISSVTASA